MKKILLTFLCLCFLLIPSFSQSNSFVAHYPLDGSSDDAGPNGFHGTNNGSVATTNVFGQPATAMSFDGQDDYIKIPNNVLANASEFSISAWIKPEGNNLDLTYHSQAIIDLRGQYQIALYWSEGGHSNPNSIDFYTNNGSHSKNVFSSSNTVMPGKWHHITVTFGENQMSLYLNGDLVGITTQTTPAPVTLSSAQSKIGKDYSSQDRFLFNGDIDNVLIYNVKLKHSEVVADYNSFNLRAYYPLNNSGYDESTNGFHGIVNGATASNNVLEISSSAMSFDGQNDFIQLPNNILANADSFSISALIKPEGDNSDLNYSSQAIIDLRGQFQIALFWTESTHSIPYSLDLYTSNGSQPSKITCDTNSVLPGEWHHVTITYGQQLLSLYLDGALIGTTLMNPPAKVPLMMNANSKIGKDYTINNRFWYKGTIDELKIYNVQIHQDFIIEEMDELLTEWNSNFLLRAHYTLDNSVIDHTANDFHGINNGSIPATNVLNEQNKAMNFDGNDYIEIPNNILIHSDEFSISAWIKPVGNNSHTNTQSQAIIDLRGQYQIALFWSESGNSIPNSLDFYINNGTQSKNVHSLPNSVLPGQWYHVTVTYANDEMALYLDGNLVGTTIQTSPAQVTISGAKSKVGKDYSSFSTYWYSGDIDDIKIYNKKINIIPLIFNKDNNGFSFKLGEIHDEKYVTNIDNKLTLQEITLYPNPSTGKFNISADDHYENVQIFNVNGMHVNTLEINGADEIDLSNLSRGWYILLFTGAKDASIHKVMIK